MRDGSRSSNRAAAADRTRAPAPSEFIRCGQALPPRTCHGGACPRPKLRSAATNGNDLHAPIFTLALAAGHDALELRQGEVDEAPIARRHGFEGDDLAIGHGLLAEALGHGGERVVTTTAVAFGVHG